VVTVGIAGFRSSGSRFQRSSSWLMPPTVSPVCDHLNVCNVVKIPLQRRKEFLYNVVNRR
jgi:hypothetical protein